MQRQEDILHQARIREIARGIRKEVEARGGLAFRGGAQQDGGEWVDVELGGGHERVVESGRQSGGVRIWFEDVRGAVGRAGSALEEKSRGVWEWAHRGENMVVPWVRLAIMLCLLAVILAVFVVNVVHWLNE